MVAIPFPIQKGASLTDWLRINYPDTYAQFANMPREASRIKDTKDKTQRRKIRSSSPMEATEEAANRPL